jgi:hypothetical protein
MNHKKNFSFRRMRNMFFYNIHSMEHRCWTCNTILEQVGPNPCEWICETCSETDREDCIYWSCYRCEKNEKSSLDWYDNDKGEDCTDCKMHFCACCWQNHGKLRCNLFEDDEEFDNDGYLCEECLSQYDI